MKEKDKLRVRFSKFERLILDFQFKSHEKFLNKFNQIFKKNDRDKNGIINESEFRSIVRFIDPRGELRIVVDEMLDLLDPFSNDIITYSSCVTLFSSKLVDHQGAQISVLHKLSLEDN